MGPLRRPHGKLTGTHHERHDDEEDVVGGSDRAFGLTVGGILAAIGAGRLIWNDTTDWLSLMLVGIGVALLVAGLLIPARLAPLNRSWTRLGLLMAKVVSPVVTLVIYAIAIVPIGVALKVVGHDPLQRKFKPQAQSYWIERHPPGPAPETMRHLF